MGFIKEDYVKARRKRNLIIASGIIAGVILIWIVSAFVFESSPPESTEQTKDGSKTAVNIDQPEKRRKNKSKPKDLPRIIRDTKNSVVLINTYDRKGNSLAIGSGFFITESGDIISNRHVFRGAYSAEVETSAGKFQVSKVLGQDIDNDLIRVSLGRTGKKFKPLEMSKSFPQVGENIMVIGNPMGLESTVSNGIVSAARKFPPFGKVIQITCPISPGSSGSPVLDMNGEVIGVATFQLIDGQNLNFAIPIARAQALKAAGGQLLADVDIQSTQLMESIENPFDKGVIHYSREEYEGAITCFKKAVENNSQNADAYYYLGLCYKKVKTTEAIEAFKKVIQLDSENAEAYFNLGETYIQLNMQEEAIDALRKAREIRPNYDEALLNLGIAYGMAKRYKEAISTLKKSVEIFPDTRAYYFLGVSYSGLKQPDRAIYAFKQSIEIDPENIDAYLGLGASCIIVENWRLGIKTMNEAVLIDPSNAEVHYVLGFLHLGNHDLESAELELKILKSQKSSSKLRNDLGTAISRYKIAYRRR